MNKHFLDAAKLALRAMEKSHEDAIDVGGLDCAEALHFRKPIQKLRAAIAKVERAPRKLTPAERRERQAEYDDRNAPALDPHGPWGAP